ncbi:hypothetical protein QYF61_007611 [Mycteria americana]|uniref:Interleukin n=1 Tax=Mycteria americana TaxID=33587 RepID=A0AAN7N564_MYCAM|nr:hypothetical protein QYF61_007611 [Mycteria americana]
MDRSLCKASLPKYAGVKMPVPYSVESMKLCASLKTKPPLISCLHKTHLKSICLQYQLYLLLNSHFFCLLKNEMGLIIFFLCAYVPKTAAGHCKWAEVLKDLEQIKTSKDIDVSLYTANTDEDKECQEPVMRCFFLEMKVILQECVIKNCSKTQDVLNIWKNGNASLENKLYMLSMTPYVLPSVTVLHKRV